MDTVDFWDIILINTLKRISEVRSEVKTADASISHLKLSASVTSSATHLTLL